MTDVILVKEHYVPTPPSEGGYVWAWVCVSDFANVPDAIGCKYHFLRPVPLEIFTGLLRHGRGVTDTGELITASDGYPVLVNWRWPLFAAATAHAAAPLTFGSLLEPNAIRPRHGGIRGRVIPFEELLDTTPDNRISILHFPRGPVSDFLNFLSMNDWPSDEGKGLELVWEFSYTMGHMSSLQLRDMNQYTGQIPLKQIADYITPFLSQLMAHETALHPGVYSTNVEVRIRNRWVNIGGDRHVDKAGLHEDIYIAYLGDTENKTGTFLDHTDGKPRFYHGSPPEGDLAVLHFSGEVWHGEVAAKAKQLLFAARTTRAYVFNICVVTIHVGSVLAINVIPFLLRPRLWKAFENAIARES